MANQEMLEMPDFRAQFEADRANVMGDAVGQPEPEQKQLLLLYRRKVWRCQQNAGMNGGVFPETLEVGQLPEETQQFLIAYFNRNWIARPRSLFSPRRCVRLARQTGFLPMQVCDFYLNWCFPTFREYLAARAQQGPRFERGHRTFIFNVWLSFKVQVHRGGEGVEQA